MDNQQREQAASNQEVQELSQLEEQLREANAASEYMDSAAGRIAIKIATVEIDRLVKLICSDEFVKDHTGYVVALSELKARRDWLKRLQIGGSSTRKNKILERLDNSADE